MADPGAHYVLLAEPPASACQDVTYKGIAKEFSLLGWTAFGGPSAHIGFFERRLVSKKSWMSAGVFAELFALAQCMPGPSSTQVSFAIGTVTKGVWGGLLSGCLFQYPGAIIMALIGVWSAQLLDSPGGWLDGLTSGVSAVGVALVASASKNMANKLCNQPATAMIATAAAAIAYYAPAPYTFPAAIIAGGLVTLLLGCWQKDQVVKAQEDVNDRSITSHGVSKACGAMLLVLWLVVLAVSIALVNTMADGGPVMLQIWERFYRIGSIIYGGGHVVLPMLYADVVQRSCDATTGVCTDAVDTWVTSKQFYAGLGIVQAMPGPLFNLSAYLGAITASSTGHLPMAGSALAWLGLFTPGVVIIFGVLPFWGDFRSWVVYRRALPGFNAAGVGLIMASVVALTLGVLDASEFPKSSMCLGLLAFTAVDQLKLFEPAVVAAGGALGVLAWALQLA